MPKMEKEERRREKEKDKEAKEEEEAGLALTQHVDLGAPQDGRGRVAGRGHGSQGHPDVLERVVVLQEVVGPQVRAHPPRCVHPVVWTGGKKKKPPQKSHKIITGKQQKSRNPPR